MTDRRDVRPTEQSELIATENLLNGFFHVDKLELRHTMLQSGAWTPVLERYILHRPDAVCAIVYHHELNALLFVRQFRVGTFQKDHGWMTELAAGLIDPGESPEDAVRREVREELGFEPQRIVPIRQMYTSPGILNERVFLYYMEVSEAEREGTGGGNMHEHEDLEIVAIPVDQLETFLEQQDILDAKTIVGVQWYLLQKSGDHQANVIV